METKHPWVKKNTVGKWRWRINSHSDTWHSVENKPNTDWLVIVISIFFALFMGLGLCALLSGCAARVDILPTTQTEPTTPEPTVVVATEPESEEPEVKKTPAWVPVMSAKFREIACAIARRDYRTAYELARSHAASLARALAESGGGLPHPPSADGTSSEEPPAELREDFQGVADRGNAALDEMDELLNE